MSHLEKVGYSFNYGTKGRTKKVNKFCRPARDGGLVFQSEQSFRQDLCSFGVTCNCGKANMEKGCSCWNGDEAYAIHLWVRYAVLRGKCKSKTSTLITSNEAKQLLLKIGFSEYYFSSGAHSPGFAFPGVNQTSGAEGETFFHRIKDLWTHLSRFGLPESCDFDKLSTVDRFNLEFHLAANYPDTL